MNKLIYDKNNLIKIKKEQKKRIKELEQENERLRKNAIHNDKVVDKAKWNEMLYKSRIDKAIELIKERKHISEYYLEEIIGENSIKELLNILEGSDKR